MPEPELRVLLYQLGQGGIAIKAFGIKFNSSFFGAVVIFFK